jgi:predicted CXXCH cytochrome family protein
MKTAFYCLVAALALLLVAAEPVAAQVQAKIVVVAVPDRFKAGNGNEATHGIPNVGVGARVVLKPFVGRGTSIHSSSLLGLNATSATWSFTSKPAASILTNTDIKDTALAGNMGRIVYFKPDVPGSYVVSMTVQADSAGVPQGSATATLTVTAAMFKGVGALRPSSGKTLSPFNCAPCHDQNSGPFATFKNTNHAVALTNRVNEAGGHFADYCMRCHTASTTGFGNNGGYDDYATKLGFTIPHNGPGVWDSLLAAADLKATGGNDSMLTMMGLMGIQCESCHGPAGEHVQTGDPSLMAKEHASDVCAPCHYSSDRHPKGYAWEGTAHAVSATEGPLNPQYTNRNSCSTCHIGQGFVNERIKGNPAPTTGYENPASIGCVTCHDPHSNQGMEHQLYRKTVADACVGCHQSRISSRGLHHSHQGPMLLGINATPMTAALNKATTPDQNNMFSGWQLPGYRYDNGTHSEIEDRCVTCHMAQSPDHDPTFVSPDTLLNVVGGHTWKVSWTDVNGTWVNNRGCAGPECHGGSVADVTGFTEGSRAQVQVLLDTLKALLPKRPPTAYPSPNEPKFPNEAGLTTIQAAASYNYWFVLNDGSNGVHNPIYARQLLLSSIEQLKLGAGAAAIASIRDVPGDQGNKVRIVWNQFPAELYAYNNVVNYGVWRQIESTLKIEATPKKNYMEMIQTGSVGEKYSVNGLVWKFEGTVPATKLAQYAFDATTDKNLIGTDTAGARESFYVAGYAANSAVVYSSPIFTGFAVDNMPPLKVVNFSVTKTPTGATLTWKPQDQETDVVRFNIYRGTTSDFVPGTPIATVEALTYNDNFASGDYFYKLEGVDKAGNKGEISAPVGTTNVVEVGGVPTEYALGQNYPNPFNPTTVIPFSLPSSGHVVLKVYTISGEEIATLVDREMGAGNYNFTWDGRNKAGQTVATGLYLYRMQSRDFSSVKKMVLVK